MLEIEMKFPVRDFSAIEPVLAAWEARAGEAIHEADHYYNAPDRDFAKTDEAFRLRRVGPKNVLTYKGPKQGGPAKTRTEIEVPLMAGPDVAATLCRLVERLGYRATAVVKKRRTQHHFERGGFTLAVCLDEIERLGSFVEVEIVAPEADRERAEQVLQEVVAELRLQHPEKRSYLEMVLGLG